MKEKEKVLKALANRRRLEIIVFLKRKKEATVGAIAAKIKLSIKATSKHLGILAAAEVVVKEQRRLFMFYALDKQLAPFARRIISNL